MWSLSTTQTQTDELDTIREEYGLRSRGEVARMAIDLGIVKLRKQLDASTLVARSSK